MNEIYYDLSEKQYLTPQDVVELLGININTVYTLCRENKLPAKKIGRQWRVYKKELDKMYKKFPEKQDIPGNLSF